MRRLLVLVLAAAAPLALHAQPATPSAEPKVQRIVIEDDNARIEELRVRGLTRRIVVKPKVGPTTRAYEIVPADGGRDLSAGPDSARGAAGQRVWSVLAF